MDKLIIIAGPTATGKSDAAVALSKAIGGEVISADSVQVYKGLDIGSAKITAEEMQGVPHHLIDVLEPEEPFNITIFQYMAKEAMKGIYERGHIPVICGGTGFYIQSVLYDIEFTTEDTDMSYRHELEKKSTEELYAMLKEVDPDSCETIHANNTKRVIRALEFYHETGYPISAHNAEQRSRKPAYDAYFFVLTDDRAKLYERIDARVDKMIAAGLVDEVRALKERGVPRMSTAMQGLGYKEIYDHLAGECSLDEAIYKIKRDSRHFAKRQITWFKREPDAIWIDRSRFANPSRDIVEFMLSQLSQHS